MPAFVLLTGMLFVPLVTGNIRVLIATAGAFILGAILYPALQHARRRGWFEFAGTTPDEFKERLYTMYSVPEDNENAAEFSEDMGAMSEREHLIFGQDSSNAVLP